VILTPPISLEELRHRLSYDPATGELTWVRPIGQRWRELVGRRAGCRELSGYRSVRLNGHNYREHRIIWFYVTGVWPTHEIDHRDLDRANNRWDNLRAATGGQNKHNRRAQTNNRLGLKGVRQPVKGRCSACIRYDGRDHYLGRFDTPEKAHARYAEEAARLYGEFGRAA